MLFLKPYTLEKPWGDQLLVQYGAVSRGNPIGEILTACAKPGEASTVVGGPFNGCGLDYVWQHSKQQFGRCDTPDFPLIIALVHAAENLSIQVHPNDEKARLLEGSARGKEESWVFYNAPPRLIGGTKCARSEVENLISESRWSDIYDTVPVAEGDYVHVVPGTLHAMTAGSFVYEIQQSNDYTYRFYDYDRIDSNGLKRPLALSKALGCLDASLSLEIRPFEKNTVFREKTYCIWQLDYADGGVLVNPADVFICCTVLSGAICSQQGEATQGMSIILSPFESLPFTGNTSIMFARPR